MELFDTYTKETVDLPLPRGPVRMYICGPTTYARAHIGNARPFVIGMWWRSWLKVMGYDVTFVHNITDVNDKIYAAPATARAPSSPSRRRSGTRRTSRRSASACRRRCRRPRQNVPVIVEYIEALIEQGMPTRPTATCTSASRASRTTESFRAAGSRRPRARLPRSPARRPRRPRKPRRHRTATALDDAAAEEASPAEEDEPEAPRLQVEATELSDPDELQAGRRSRTRRRMTRATSLSGRRRRTARTPRGTLRGQGPARLAHRVLGDGGEHPRRVVRDPRRRHRPALPAPRKRARAVEGARPRVRADLGAQRLRQVREREDVEVGGQPRHDPRGA